jgi:hypothetical protein
VLNPVAQEKLNACNNSLLNNSDMEMGDYSEMSRNQSRVSYQHSDNYNSVAVTKKIGFQEFKANFLQSKNKRKLIPAQSRLSRKLKNTSTDNKENFSLNVNFKRRNKVMSLPRKHSNSNKAHNGPLINKTIEHHDMTMIEEFTDTVIPEFTLGPTAFDIRPRPKPLSVNRMGFYEECSNFESLLSPIKQ